MSSVARATSDWVRSVVNAWNGFWFSPTDPATLSLIRVLAGLMLLYTHLVWTLGLNDFFGPNAWVSSELMSADWVTQAQDQGRSRVYYWSLFQWFQSPTALWVIHISSLIIFLLLTLGLWSRAIAVLAYLATLNYLHRASGALFGLDQINVMLAMYLMIGPCGARYSLDALLRRRKERRATIKPGDAKPSIVKPGISANLAIRLIQIHMCVIYFYAGTRKLMGSTWWDGTAMWGSVANLEYQTVDLTWLADWPMFGAFLTHLTIWFEVSYFALVWPRLSRPVVLALAVLMHLGIAFCMGMITFGLVMLIGNLAFVTPAIVRGCLERRPAQA